MFATSVSAASTKDSSQSGEKNSQFKKYIMQRWTRIEHYIIKNLFYNGKGFKLLSWILEKEGQNENRNKSCRIFKVVTHMPFD